MDLGEGEEGAGVAVYCDDEGVHLGAKVEDVAVDLGAGAGYCEGGEDDVWCGGFEVVDELGDVEDPLGFAGRVVEGDEGSVPGWVVD